MEIIGLLDVLKVVCHMIFLKNRDVQSFRFSFFKMTFSSLPKEKKKKNPLTKETQQLLNIREIQLLSLGHFYYFRTLTTAEL